MKQKICTPLEALKRIKSGDRVYLSSICGEPRSITTALERHWAELANFRLVFSIHASYSFLAGLGERFTGESWAVQGPMQDAVASGSIAFHPARYSRVPALLEPGNALAIDVAIVAVSPPDDRGYCSLGAAVGLTRDLIAHSPLVIAEINKNVPRTFGDGFVHVRELDVLVESNEELATFLPAKVGSRERDIASYVAKLVPDGSTIQIGIGAIPDAVATALHDKNDLGIHSGMLGDSLAALIDRGVVTNARKAVDRYKSVTGELIGTATLLAWAHENPALLMKSVSYTHRLDLLAQISNLVTINSALEIDLSGQINAETIGSRQVSTVGGQFDFVEAATHTFGGLNILAMPSTAGKGKISRIVARMSPGSIVSIPRYLADKVVTEFGVADLRDKTLSERAEALIAIAHPDCRSALADDRKISSREI